MDKTNLNTDLFSRLKRLFSTDVIIRGNSENQLKVVDIGRLQSYGQVQTNRLVDRFYKVHRSAATAGFNPTLNYQTLRLQIYSEYEAMDTDPILASALDIIADECTTKSEQGEVLSIKSTNADIQKRLYNLFYDVLNVEFNLWPWVRNLTKFGDHYLLLGLAEDYGVINCVPLSPYEVIRDEMTDEKNPSYVRFRLDPASLAGAVSRVKPEQTYENYEIAHFRLLSDVAYLPYGRSYLEPTRKVWKQLTLLEDAAMLHRVMRAPEKRIFFHDVGSIPPNEVESYMNKAIGNLKRMPQIDPNTGEMNLRYQLMNAIEDFHIPTRGNNSATKIETTKGLEYVVMDDIEYLKNKMMAALKIPKAYLGYEGELQGKSVLSAEDIRFARTIERFQKIIVSELYKIAIVHLYIQGIRDEELVNFELSLTSPSIIFEQEKLNLWKEKVDLAKNILDSKLFSKKWTYDNIFQASDETYDSEQTRILDEAEINFRLAQIENEGNDPTVTGKSYGTPHDLASMYNQKVVPDSIEKHNNVPSGYDETEPEPEGRPKSHASNYGTEQSPFGSDPLGKKGVKDVRLDKQIANARGMNYENANSVLNSFKRTTRLFNTEPKTILTEKKSILDEENIK
jgi:hypothetical protein